MTTDHAAWQVKDDAILVELIELMDLTAAEAALLGDLAALAHDVAPRLAETFYQRLMAHENTAEYLRQTSLDARHNTIGQWFIDLFRGVYDAEYARKRMVIGHVHVRIGLPVRYPLAMIDVVLQFGELVARRSPQAERAVAAFRKVLSLDVAIFNQAYEDNQLAHLSSMVGGERLARRLLAGSV
jgi:hypothetical protein